MAKKPDKNSKKDYTLSNGHVIVITLSLIVLCFVALFIMSNIGSNPGRAQGMSDLEYRDQMAALADDFSLARTETERQTASRRISALRAEHNAPPADVKNPDFTLLRWGLIITILVSGFFLFFVAFREFRMILSH